MGFLSNVLGGGLGNAGGFLNDVLGMGKGPSQTSTSTVNMPDWLQKPSQDLVSQATTLANKAYNPYSGQTVAGFNPTQQQGLMQQTQLAQQGSGAYNAANDQLTSTLQGGGFRPAATNPYAGSNPYLSQQIDAAQGDVIRNYNNVTKPQTEAAMVRSGSFGNSGLMQYQQDQQRDLTDSLGRISSGMRFNDYAMQGQMGENAANRSQGAYEAERQRQYGAIGATPGFTAARYNDARMLQDAGATMQGQEQRGLDDQYGRFQAQERFPYQQQQYLQSILGPMMNTYAGRATEGTQDPGAQNKALNTIGTVAQLGSMIFSDRRLKTGIKKVGKTDDGMGVYTYRYKGDDRTHMGLMAQEVRKKHPDAVGEVAGLLAVDYSKV
jgi:hypothetical protein